MKTADFIESVNIIGKYLAPQGYALVAEHDQIWFGEYTLVTSEEDRTILEKFGWFKDGGSWSFFV